MLPYRLNELDGTQLVPLPTGKKKQPPTGWTGNSAQAHDIEEFYDFHDYSEFANQGIAFTDESYAGFDFDLYRTGQKLEEVTQGQELPWTVAVSRRWEPDVEGFTVFYRLPFASHLLSDSVPVDVIRKGHRYSVINGEVEDKEYFLYWTNGVEFHRIDADTFAGIWETLPAAPAWLTERHKRPAPKRTRTSPSVASEALVEAAEGSSTYCARIASVSSAGLLSVSQARSTGNSINQTMMLAQWALTAYVNHSGYSTAIEALRSAYAAACDETADHPYSEYEWETSLQGAYRKRGITSVSSARRCSCSQTLVSIPTEEKEATVEGYYPLILSEVTKAGFYGAEREDLAQDVAVKIIKANPKTLTAAYVRSAVRSVSVDEYRRREAQQRLRVSIASAQIAGEQTRPTDHAEALNRLVIQDLARSLSPRENEAVQAHLAGEKLSNSLHVRFSVAKKKMRALVTT